MFARVDLIQTMWLLFEHVFVPTQQIRRFILKYEICIVVLYNVYDVNIILDSIKSSKPFRYTMKCRRIQVSIIYCIFLVRSRKCV